MRFPRTNLTDAAEISAEVDAHQDEDGTGERPAPPIWQSNFSLAPNVRFTRTPENLLRRTPPEIPQLDEPVEVVVAEAAQAVESRTPILVDVPFDAHAPQPAPAVRAPLPPVTRVAAQPVVRPPLLPIVRTPVQPAAPVHVPSLPEAPVAAGPYHAAGELASISDFAFWEVMAFEEGAAPAAPQFHPVPMPKVEVSAESIIANFRVMEWHPHRRMEAAPAAAPSAIAPAPIAAPAPAAPAALAAPPQAKPVQPAAPVPQPAPVEARTQPIAPIPVRTPSVAPVTMPAQRLAVAKPAAAKVDASGYEFPPNELLQQPPERLGEIMTQEALEQNAGLLESVLEDFGIKGEIIHVRPGPVVTLYEFEPAPGVKSSRVIGLADDIARSMSALSARVAVVPGRNVIGIELPNQTRETVYFREMIESQDFAKSSYKLALGLGKTIGGEPVIAELAKMPHLLVAGTTGSGKSVAINTMILSLLYRMSPEQCRLIMVDPKMLELSVYDGIPHLLTPVVTDPKKAVMALKWAVREMEERYRKMSRLGVRNIDGYNGRVAQAREKDETIHIMVPVGFDKGTGAPIEEQQELDLTPMPYIVVIVDEMADLMMVAGKDIEGAIQRLAQMARAAGIHLIMATQRPSVDVITGTIKANFPTRISFQVTSKIDSRTILGEQGAEQLLGQGDMLHMQGGGRIARVHGPFVSDLEVEKVVAHLKTQGRPEYLDTVTAGDEEEEEAEDSAVFDKSAMGAEDGDELYQQAVKVVLRDKKCSTSYIQRRLGIGYNRAASLVERMEKEGLVGPANHVGKREIVSARGEGE
ncbi:DNA translocase FtsK [Rhizobium sp. SIMBA_035]